MTDVPAALPRGYTEGAMTTYTVSMIYVEKFLASRDLLVLLVVDLLVLSSLIASEDIEATLSVKHEMCLALRASSAVEIF